MERLLFSRNERENKIKPIYNPLIGLISESFGTEYIGLIRYENICLQHEISEYDFVMLIKKEFVRHLLHICKFDKILPNNIVM